MTPTEIELRAKLQRLADYARTEPRAADLGPTIGEERRRPRQVWTAGVAAAVLVVAAVTGVALSRRGGSSAIEGGPAAERLAGAGLAGRWGPSSVWTGRELLVWGGLTSENRSLGDGAALDPVANRWRPLPPAPIGPRSGAPAVWTGSEMLVWGGPGGGREGPPRRRCVRSPNQPLARDRRTAVPGVEQVGRGVDRLGDGGGQRPERAEHDGV